jgi:hypothetical protein
MWYGVTLTCISLIETADSWNQHIMYGHYHNIVRKWNMGAVGQIMDINIIWIWFAEDKYGVDYTPICKRLWALWCRDDDHIRKYYGRLLGARGPVSSNLLENMVKYKYVDNVNLVTSILQQEPYIDVEIVVNCFDRIHPVELFVNLFGIARNSRALPSLSKIILDKMYESDVPVLTTGDSAIDMIYTSICKQGDNWACVVGPRLRDQLLRIGYDRRNIGLVRGLLGNML